eukprot:3258558-Lingulodinium_polyedra.AAC.1
MWAGGAALPAVARTCRGWASLLDAFATDAGQADGIPPTAVGYGITSDTIRECSCDSLLATDAGLADGIPPST